ncbi:MAG TPA: TetR family transcriptional regulator [Mycobacteriales bacterium]|nr:TetR family transcriptional regulator [Mycobacteriales bacterium]
MGRPKTPLIDREAAIARSLDIIDRDGVDGFSIRKLGTELGVNGASLYHHFKDKDDILEGVKNLVLREAGVVFRDTPDMTWQEHVTRSVTRYRKALLNHPNTAPLMAPDAMRPHAAEAHDYLIRKMTEDGVPSKYAYAILESVETLAYGSAALNPRKLRPAQRFSSRAGDTPSLAGALRVGPKSADGLFQLELSALLEGWTTLVRNDNGGSLNRT